MDRLLRRCLTLSCATSSRPTTCFRAYTVLSQRQEFLRIRRQQRRGPPPAPVRELHKRVESIVENGGDLHSASRILREAILSGTRAVHTTGTLLLGSMCKAGLYQDVISLFDFLYREESPHRRKPFIDAYNALVEAHVQSGNIDQALQVYHQIVDKEPVTGITYRLVTQALVSANRITEARDALKEMSLKCKCNRADPIAYSNVISAYLDRNDLESANQVLNQLFSHNPYRSGSYHDGIIYARFMEYYFQNNMEEEAMQSYQSFLDTRSNFAHPDACNRLLEVLLKYGRSVEANLLFQDQLNLRLNSFTYTIMVNECFRLGKVSDAISVFKKRGTHREGPPFAMDAPGYNNIIEKLYAVGEVAEADKLFQEMLDKSVKTDTATFGIVLDAWFQQDRIDDVLKWFSYMLFDTDLKPATEFLNSVFSRLLNKGRIEEAGEILERMQHRDQDAFPVFTYELVLLELRKRGKLDQVRRLLGLIGKYNINITPTLHGVLREALGKEHRTDQIEGLFGKPLELGTRGV